MDSMRGSYVAVVAITVIMIGCSGCLTTHPTIHERGGDADVFESVSTSDEWGTSSIQATVTLTPTAVTDRGVTRLVVIAANGDSFYSTTVDSGQTAVSLPLSTGQTSQIIAVNTVNGTVVGKQNVTVGGNEYP